MGTFGSSPDALEGETERKGPVIAPISSSGCIISVVVGEGCEGATGRQEAFRSRYGVTFRIGRTGDGEADTGAGQTSGTSGRQAAAGGELQQVTQGGAAFGGTAGSIRNQVRTADEYPASVCAVVGQFPADGSRDGLVVASVYQVNHEVVVRIHRIAFEGFVAAGYERIPSGGLDGFAVNKGVIEGIAGYQHSFQAGIGVAQPLGSLFAGFRAVEVLLVTAEGRRLDIRDTRVLPEVESLLG